MKDTNGKNRMDLVPSESLEEIAKIFTFGAEKYAVNDWMQGIDYSSLIGAYKRHAAAFERNENVDPESGHYHLAHAATNMMMLLFYQVHQEIYEHNDDRVDRTLLDLNQTK
ncbi:MAG: DUF5664 domain-containing protein [Clostridium sp.]